MSILFIFALEVRDGRGGKGFGLWRIQKVNCTGTTSQKLVKNITIPIWSMHLSVNNN